VESDGVTVEKSFDPDDFPVPAIAFSIRADREDAVTVRLVDTVPDDVEPENIGFHPKYGAEFWDVVDGTIVFEREFAPGEEYTTVYGLRGENADVPEKFLSEPRLESVEPPLDADAAAGIAPDADPELGDDTGRAPDSEPESDPELDLEPPVSGPGDSRTPDPTDESASETPDADASATADSSADVARQPGPEADAASGGEVTDGSLLESLTAEIEAADPDDPELAALRDALGMDLTRASVEARIEHLQSTVSDLEAYTDALEAFLDENGDAQQVLEDVQESNEELEKRLTEVEATADRALEEASSVNDRIDEDIESLHSEVQALESDLEELSSDVSKVVEMRDRLANALGGFAGETGGSDAAGNDVESGQDSGDAASADGDDESNESAAE
jgi:archaellum component FlaC